ncbi:MAG: glycosyltransferase [Phycisphaerales bacterium]|nr:glycosyltransferase [Phycisphaerales bacterium]
MRILHISTRLILGGSQENTVLSCEGQARLGHEVHLAFGPIFGPEGSMLARVRAFEGEGRSIACHEVPSLVRQVSPGQDRRALRALQALIERLSPDIVHTHSSKAGILGRLAAWRSRRRATHPIGIVHTIHGPPFMPLDGGVLKRAKVRAINRAYAVAERRAARRCDVIVSVADAMTAQFLARGIGHADLYRTVRSGMEIDAFVNPGAGEDRVSVRQRLGVREADVVIGTVARLAEHKGHEDLLRALASDLRENPGWKLLWVGDGWWRSRLIRTAREAGLGVVELDRAHAEASSRARSTDSVILTGLVPPERVPGLMRAMDILAHPSLREGLPRTVPQALLAGAAPVAYDFDGTGEVCVDGVTGLLVRTGDVAGLGEAIRTLARDAELRRRLAEEGRARVIKPFDARTMVRELEGIYALALTRARQAGRKG